MEPLWRRQLIRAAAALLCLSAAHGEEGPHFEIQRLKTIEVPGRSAEIVAFAPAQRLLLATNSADRQLLLFDVRQLDPPDVRALELDPALDHAQGILLEGEPTSVAVHPTQPVAFVTAPHPDRGNRGGVFVVDLREESRGRIIGSQPVGFHPDSIAIAPNGRWAVIAAEAEGDPNLPGSASVLELAGWTVAEPLSPAGFPAHELFPPAKDLAEAPGNIEPEYVAMDPRSRFAAISLQENDAVWFVDLRGTPPVSAGVLRLPAGAHPDGVALLDGAAGEPNDALMAVCEEGGAARDGVFHGHALSFWRVSPERLPEAQLLSRVELLPLYAGEDGRRRRVDPESVALVRFQRRVLALATLERRDEVIVFEVTDPKQPARLGSYATGRRPEGIIVIPAGDDLIVITGDEGAGDDRRGQITIGRVRTRKP